MSWFGPCTGKGLPPVRCIDDVGLKCVDMNAGVNRRSLNTELSSVNIPSYHYMYSCYKDNRVSWPSYLYNENSYIWKNRLYTSDKPFFLKQWWFKLLAYMCVTQSRWDKSYWGTWYYVSTSRLVGCVRWSCVSNINLYIKIYQWVIG